MDLFRLKNKFLIVLCLFVLFLPFYLITFVYADSEITPIDYLDGKYVSSGGYINTSEQGGGILIYHFYPNCAYTLTNTSTDKNLYYSTTDTYVTSGIVGNRYSLSKGTTVDIDISDSDTYLFIYITSLSDGENMLDYIKVVNTSSNMGAAIGGLVSEAGPRNLWNIFENCVSYIAVIVLVAFGLFIIIRIVKKLSKAKGGM